MTIHTAKKIKSGITYTVVALLYCLFLSLIYQRTGIVTINEADKYISAAKRLLEGDMIEVLQSFFFYSSYIFFTAAGIFTGGIKTVVIAQALLSFISAVCIKKTINLLTGSNRLAFAGMLFFLFSYPLQYWILTLFSDSYFVSLIGITLYYTLKNKSSKEFSFWVFLNILLVTSRPPGVFFVTMFGLYFLHNSRIIATKKLIITGIVAFAVIYLSLFYLPVETKGYIKPIAAGAIIVDSADYDLPAFEASDKSTLASAYQYLISKHSVSYVAKLYIKKLVSFFTLTRPYYSKFNNGVLLLHYFLYLLSIPGLILLYKKNRAVAFLFIFSIFLAANLVALTYNEWHYRFTLTIFPILIVLSASGVSYLSERKLKN
ncbi:MAG: glycosyltransferase family 39 protein [Chitinophagaceae bacterium]|nr:glycosyltransferase family 39 protein [Chitinophagaceae bacterium]